jgi:lysophospholipase L1-like esterase
MRRGMVGAVCSVALTLALGIGMPSATVSASASAVASAETPLCAPVREALLVGDSLVARASDAYTAAFAESGWNLTVVAHGGRTVRWGLAQLKEQLKRAITPSVVVVALGTNDIRTEPASQAQVAGLIRKYVSVVGDQRTLVWVNIALKPGLPQYYQRYVGEAEFNNALKQVEGESRNFQVLDWKDALEPSQFLGDGVHYQPGEYLLRGRVIADAALRVACESYGPAPGPTVRPRITQVTRTSASIAWDPPSSGPIPSGYDVEYAASPAGPWKPFMSGDSALRSRTITGLGAASTYYIRVAAIAGNHRGPWTTAAAKTPIDAVAAGPTSTCVIYVDHELACAGENGGGWIDPEASGAVTRLSHVLSDVSDVSISDTHACVIRTSRAVACWGSNSQGVLGNGHTSGSQTEALDVSGVAGAISIGTSDTHSCAVISLRGSVWCWGANVSGQLGDSATTLRASPARVRGLGAAKSVAVGPDFTCALLSDGSVWCWGANTSGQLGDGTQIARSQPRQVTALSQVTQVSASDGRVCALLRDATVWCWGRDTSLVPSKIPHIAGAVEISTSKDHACAVVNTGSLKCWGANAYGQLGIGTTESATPTQVLDIQSAVSVATSDTGSCALLVDGRLRCWGANRDGQFGDGTGVATTAIATPTAAGGLDQFVRTLGTRTTPISIKTASGVPVTGGSISWSSSRTVARKFVGLTALGIAKLPSTPAGQLRVSMSGGILPGGIRVSGAWTVWQNGQPRIALTVPDPPASGTRYIRVTVAGNRRVVGAHVSVRGLSGRASLSGFTYTINPARQGSTPANGIFAARGFAISAAPVVSVEYSDEVIRRRVANVVLDREMTVIRIPSAPFLGLPIREIRADVGAVVPVTARLYSPAGDGGDAKSVLAGYAVTINPPTGVAQTCPGVNLTAITDSEGRASLAVCATQSGTYEISAPGVITTAVLSLFVQGGAPGPVTKVVAESPESGRILVSWSPPDFIGGRNVPIVSYAVMVSDGQTPLRTVVLQGSGPLHRHVSFRGLDSAKTYKVAVTATNYGGTSAPSYSWVGVA